MAIEQVNEITGRGGDRHMDTTKRYTRVFQVITSDPTDGTQTIRDAPGIPAYGDNWVQATAGGGITDEDLNSWCVEKRATQSDENNLCNWMVSCEYVGRDDPTFEPPRVHWTSEKYQETSQQDALAQPVVNSAGILYASGITSDRHRRILVIERNVLIWDPTVRDAYIDTLNMLPFLSDRYPPGFPPETAKIDDLDAEPVFYPDYTPGVLPPIWYYREIIKISIDPKGWEALYLDAGYDQLVTNLITGNTAPMRIIDPSGYSPVTPWLLDGTGHLLPTGGNPVYKQFIKYLPSDWSPLNITY